MKQLTDRLEEIIQRAGGTWGISLEDPDTQETWSWNGDELFYAASVIKVPIMIAVFEAVENGEVSLSSTLELKRENLVGGSGVLQHMTPGTLLTVYDVMTLMIIQSDNTATNMLIDLVGTENIQKTMNEIGLVHSKFYNKLMTVPVKRKGNNLITASEMTMMLKKMITGKIVSMHACEQMIAIMKKQQIRDCLPGKLPTYYSDIIGKNMEWEIANKTGMIHEARHDIGVFYVGKRKMIASVLSKGLDDFKSQQLFMDIGLEIYHYLNPVK